MTVPILTISAPTPRSRLLTVDLGPHRFPFIAGQAVMLTPQGDTASKPYSIACSPEHLAATGRLELLIAMDEESPTDPPWATPGALVDVEGPLGAFTLPAPVDQPRLLFVAGGAGIAPLRAMINHALALYPDRRISVLYSARRADEFAFIDELREHQRRGRLELHQTVTREERSTWQGRRGRIGRAQFEAVVHEPKSTLCFVCGPPAMVEEAVTVLKHLGVPETLIKTEQWGR